MQNPQPQAPCKCSCLRITTGEPCNRGTKPSRALCFCELCNCIRLLNTCNCACSCSVCVQMMEYARRFVMYGRIQHLHTLNPYTSERVSNPEHLSKAYRSPTALASVGVFSRTRRRRSSGSFSSGSHSPVYEA